MNVQQLLRRLGVAVLLGTMCMALPACGDSSADTQVAERQFAKSVLDDIEDEKNPPKKRAATADASDEGAEDTEHAEAETDDEGNTRTLARARTSRSRLGRTRDMAIETRNKLQGGAGRTGERAETYGEHYIEVGNLKWDVPEDWQINIPPAMFDATMTVVSDLGNGEVWVTSQMGTPPNQFIKQWESMFMTSMGNRARAKTTVKEISGHQVHVAKLNGIFDHPLEGEKAFWSLNGAIIEREGKHPVVFIFQGPEDTIEQNGAQWMQMLESMTKR